MAVLTEILNPFNPQDRITKEIYSGLALFTLLNKYNEDLELVVSLNGKITEDYEYIIKSHDSIAIVPIPKGGGGGKNPLRTIAMLALTLVAPEMGAWAKGIYASSAMAAGVGTAAGYATAYAIGYGATILAGGMLINALMPVETAKATSSSLEEVSPTYAFSGGSNANIEGSSLPIMLGYSRVAPPIIGSYLSLDGDKQYLNVLMAVNDGEVDSISDVKINNQDISSFNNVSVETRLGTNNQTVITGFKNSTTTFNVGITLNETTTTTYTTNGNSVQGLEIVINLPQGHFNINSTGKYVLPEVPLSYKIEYKKTSDTEFTELVNVTLDKVYKTTQRLAYPLENVDADEYDIKITRLSAFSEDSATANSLQLEYINEIIYDEFIYPNVALLSVKAMATDQLNGSFPTITAIVDNTTTRDVLKPKNNPAWACYDLLKREGIPDIDINLVKFQEWADYCDTEEFTCNLYMDTKQELQSALNMISVLGRATVVQMGSVFTPIVSNVVDIPTQSFLFTSGNIIEGSLSLSNIKHSERSNVIEVTYYDEEDDYNAQTIQLQADFFDSSTREIKSTINLYGCTKREIAIRYAQFLLNQNKYITEMVTFQADVDAIACTVGDVIKVGVKYMSDTLAEGRIVSASSTQIVLDQKVEIKANVPYEIQYRTQDDEIHTLDVPQIATTTITDTITTTVIDIPQKYDVFAFGEQSSEVTNLYRVLNISRASDQKRNITALEYNPTVYDDNTTIALPETREIEAVQNLQASSYLVKQTEGYKVGLSLLWQGTKLSYKVYYKKASETNYTEYTTTSTTNVNFLDLDYGELYDFKVEDKTIQATFEDITIPPDVSSFTISGLDKDIKTLNFSMDKPVDFKGFEIRYQLGDYPVWSTARKLTDEVITTSPYLTSLIDTKGTYTLMIKAVDIFGNYSENHSSIVFEQALSYFQNLVFSENFKEEGFTGTKTNFEVNVDGNLEAITDNGDSTWTAEYIDIFYTDAGELAKITFEGDGSPLIYYRSFGEEPFYDGGDAYKPSTDYVYREVVQNDWTEYPSGGFTAMSNVPYQVKIVYTNSIVKPIVREFKVEVDATDLFEYQDDVTIPDTGLRIYANNIDSVKWVGTVLQDTGTGAVSANYVKYNDGAFIKCFDSSGTQVEGLVDILLKGFANG